jgi:hypothetical protein
VLVKNGDMEIEERGTIADRSTRWRSAIVFLHVDGSACVSVDYGGG